MSMDLNYKEVYFYQWCGKCVHEELNEYEDPCNECLLYGVREGSHKPTYFKEKEVKEN